MTVHTDRQRRVEKMLIEEFEAEGYRVIDDKGHQCALIPSLQLTGEITEFARIDLSRLAEIIEVRLP